MGFKDTLGSIWPNYGAVTGRGSYGQALNPDQAAENADEDAKKQHAAEMRKINESRDAINESMSQGMKKGGKVSSASKRADGIAQRGKTKGRMV